ncbi:MAG: 1-phosphofructokinase [Clostridia bacterium]|nr:1-phosphofructokinase [Clostridia bacterium]
MIYTVTLNPSLDYIMRIPHFRDGEVNRSAEEAVLPGGKGINVSLVLQNLHIPSVALGITAGFTGAEIERLLLNRGIQSELIRLENGFSRINVKLKAEQETEVNGNGPAVSSNALDALYGKIKQLNEGDILVLAGSVPGSIPKTIYADIAEFTQNKNIKLIVDAEKNLLSPCLQYKPYLIKPNHIELADFFGVEIRSLADVKHYAVELRELGARNVMVSMAGDGAILASEDGEVCFCPAPRGKVINSTGAGDSTVAGFLTAKEKHFNYADCLRFAACAGSASAFSQNLATEEQILALFGKISPETVKKL